MLYHSEPLTTDLIVSFNMYNLNRSLYGKHSVPSTEQIMEGALQSASNPQRKAFFLHAWVVTGQLSGWLFVVSLCLTIGDMIFSLFQKEAVFIVLSTILYVVASAVAGVTFKFHDKIKECVLTNQRLVSCTQQELIRRLIIGGLCGLGISIFLHLVASYMAGSLVQFYAN